MTKAQRWYANPKNRQKHQDKALKRRYGITRDDFNRMFTEQNGLCGLCQELKATDVDHNHRTNKVRGLLCRACNLMLGFIEREPGTLGRIVTWLSK